MAFASIIMLSVLIFIILMVRYMRKRIQKLRIQRVTEPVHFSTVKEGSVDPKLKKNPGIIVSYNIKCL